MEQEPTPQIVTLVEQQKRNKHRFNIHLNGTYAFSVHEDLLLKHRLFKGAEVEEEGLQAILVEDEKHRAYLEAIRMIGRRPHTGKELREKLKQKGYEEGVISVTIDKLTEQRYVDDRQFASFWTENRIHLQKKGRRWVQQELAQRGVSKEEIQEALSDIDPEMEYGHALELGQKKWKQTKGEARERRNKTGAFLLRRGYPMEIVSRVLRELGLAPDEEWEES
ncbi:regulatory protein RecX [Paenibacillus sp. J31TS4]|uniref:RecX family transcriptional regulator n=1 Tax=Paenibacillus sp. J31TS4 TaxID=2807195 RepID=UPI001B00357D|nr:RecX family transcriptional regulator [Paenibacillus sp. J31TS4]GIP36889.1 regulatory protein RecX [Paenibacillus sp. J31TS4]